VKVPSAERAVVDIRKLTDYCLSHEHPRGKHKARVFFSSLGMTSAHATELRDALLQEIATEECTVGAVDEYGARYIIDFTYARGGKEATIRSTWIIKVGETTPRLTSCFVL
jgi:hypothetical protein